jgi:hypothetical protein
MTKLEAVEVGDYDLRTVDFETVLIGPVTELVADAGRLAALEFRNGFPNWWIYRTCQAGDTLHTSRLRDWVVAFTIAYATTGGVRRDAYSDELAYAAGLDALHMLMHSKPMQPYTVTADALGVHHKTYRCLRDTIYARLKASMDEHWIQLGSAIRQVALYNRRNP